MLAIAWVLSDPRVTALVVGPRNPKQLDSALEGLVLRLSPAERDELGSSSRDPARGDPPRAGAAGRKDPAHAARPPGRGCLPQAREPSADRILQAARRAERDRRAPPERARGRRRDGERREHGPGRRLGGAGARRALHGGRSRERAGGEAGAIERLGGRIVKVPYERWWQTWRDSATRSWTASSSTRCRTTRVMAGNGTIGLELLEDLPEPDVVLVPFGGGGLSWGSRARSRRSGRRRRSTRSSRRPGRR